MKALVLPCLAFCSLALFGCDCSVNPLYTDKDDVNEPALAGVWNEVNGDGQLCVQKRDGKGYDLIVSDRTKKVETYQLTLVRLNEQLFADLMADKQFVGGSEVDLPVGALQHHAIVKLDVSKNDVRYASLDPDAVKHYNSEGNAPLAYFTMMDHDHSMLLTSSTDDLRRILPLYSGQLFTGNDHYTRQIDNGNDANAGTACKIPNNADH
jgi:hypothetical protein